MTGWPKAERPGDALPTAEDFGGWPRAGSHEAVVGVGPLAIRLRGCQPTDAESLEATAARGDAPTDVDLEVLESARGPFLAHGPGERSRSLVGDLGGAVVVVLPQSALLLAESGRGFALLGEQSAADRARSLQNVVRAAVALQVARQGRGLLLHASAIASGPGAVVLVGPSGAGKSTAARLAAPRAVLSDDVSLVMLDQGRLHVGTTPLWAEPGFPSRQRGAGTWRVEAILRLVQAPGHALRPVAAARAAAALAAHAPFVHGVGGIDVPGLAAALAAAAPVLDLEFAPDPRLWSVVDRHLGERSAGAPTRTLQ